MMGRHRLGVIPYHTHMPRQGRLLLPLMVGLLVGCLSDDGVSSGESGRSTGHGSSISAITFEAPSRMVEQAELTLAVQMTRTDTVRVARPDEISWSVSPSGAATISAEGQLKALTPGTLTVEASAVNAPKVTASRVIVVDSAAITSLTFVPIMGIIPGDTVAPQVTGRDALGRTRQPRATITSLDPVFTPAGPGVWRATSIGSGRFRATVGTLSSELTVTVAVGAVQALVVPAGSSLLVGSGQTLGILATDRRGNLVAPAPALVATSRVPSVVAASVVNDSLRVTAVGPGQGYVVVTRGAVRDSVQVTVTGPTITALVVTPLSPKLDWVNGLEVRVQTRNSLNQLQDAAMTVSVQQLDGEAGLVGWQATGGATGRVLALLPPFAASGQRRDVGARPRVVFTYGAIKDTLEVTMNYRRATAMITTQPATLTMALGESRVFDVALRDSTGATLPPSDILGLMDTLISSRSSVVATTAPATFRAVGPGTASVVRTYREGVMPIWSRYTNITVLDTLPPPPGDSTPIGTGYIQIRPVVGLTPTQRAAVLQAINRIEAVIGGTPRDPYPMTASAGACIQGAPAVNENLSGLMIQMNVLPVDGPGGGLAAAGWCGRRAGSQGLPVLGLLFIDTADIYNLITSGAFTNVVAHEVLHALGIGTMWTQWGVAPDPNNLGADPRFTGVGATAAYAMIGGSGGVPIETLGGAGTAGAHWRESVFRSELMTGWIGSGVSPLSRMTAASLGDIGYTVNLNAAESYTLGSLLAGLRAPEQKIHLQETILMPQFIVHKDGRMERLPNVPRW